MNTPFSCFGEVVIAAWRDLDTPLCHKLLELWDRGEWDQIMRMRVSPRDYLCSEEYFRDAQAIALIRKLPVKIGGVDPEEAALQKMWQAEKVCYVTNRRFEQLLDHMGPFTTPQDARVLAACEIAKKHFRRLVGPLPDWDKIHPRFGPGAVVETVKGRVSPLDKISVRPTTYPAAQFLEQDWAFTAWSRSLGYDSSPVVIRGERFSTVPKDWDINRTIGIGASLPVYYQLGVGSYLRRRLKHFGIDLEASQARHRQVACDASRRGDSATVDLVSASDRIARNVVRYFCTPEWFTFLDCLRAAHLQVRGRWYRLERFSSMGNGFTFELMTAMLLAISMTAVELSGLTAVPGVNTFVYGDDIIVPKEAYTLLIAMLKYFGHEPNEKKSFGDGPFRESCGGDFWCGEVVRPFFQKEFPREPHEWIAVANGLRRAAMHRWGDLGPLRRAWFRALDRLPVNIRRCRGPVELGDLVVHDSPDHWQVTLREGGRRYIRVWRPVSRKIDLRRYDASAVLAYALAGYPSDLALRGEVAGYRFGRAPLIVTAEYNPVSSYPHHLLANVLQRGMVKVEWWGYWRYIP